MSTTPPRTISIPLSNDCLKTIWKAFDGKAQETYFKSILEVNHSTGKSLTARDFGTGIRIKKLKNGDKKVTFDWVIDDDHDPKNGRIFMHDEFTLSGPEKKFRKFQRKFEFNNKGSNRKRWRRILAKYRSAPLPQHELRKKFGNEVARQLPMGFFLSRLKDKVPYDFMLKTAQEVHRLTGLGLRFADEQSWFRVRYFGKEKVDTVGVMIITVADTDANPKNGRIFIYDDFTFQRTEDGKFRLLGFFRDFGAAEDSKLRKEWEKLVEKLQGTFELAEPGEGLNPSFKKAEEFIQHMGEAILPLLPKSE